MAIVSRYSEERAASIKHEVKKGLTERLKERVGITDSSGSESESSSESESEHEGTAAGSSAGSTRGSRKKKWKTRFRRKSSDRDVEKGEKVCTRRHLMPKLETMPRLLLLLLSKLERDVSLGGTCRRVSQWYASFNLNLHVPDLGSSKGLGALELRSNASTSPSQAFQRAACPLRNSTSSAFWAARAVSASASRRRRSTPSPINFNQFQ